MRDGKSESLTPFCKILIRYLMMIERTDNGMEEPVWVVFIVLYDSKRIMAHDLILQVFLPKLNSYECRGVFTKVKMEEKH